jgi:hypothetical protein
MEVTRIHYLTGPGETALPPGRMAGKVSGPPPESSPKTGVSEDARILSELCGTGSEGRILWGLGRDSFVERLLWGSAEGLSGGRVRVGVFWWCFSPWTKTLLPPGAV